MPHQRPRLGDMGLEARSVSRSTVPVNGEEVELAARARVQEVLEIGQTLGGVSVRDGRPAEQDEPFDRHHVFLVGLDDVRDLLTGAAAAALVWLVEVHHGFGGVFADVVFDGVAPDSAFREVGRQDGHEFDLGVAGRDVFDAAVWRGGPVPGPGDLAPCFEERLNQPWVVEREAAFAVTHVWCWGGG